MSERILPGATITQGPQSWQVVQRNENGLGEIHLSGEWQFTEPCTVEVRVACESNGASAAGCDWQDARMHEPNTWTAVLHVPAGGPYRIETRGRANSNAWCLLNGDKIWHVFVGDIWVIAGQSNAVGIGHGVVEDPPAIGVSVFGGNEIWNMASHPLFNPAQTKHPANRDDGWVDASPWLTFGRDILQKAGIPVGLVPAALGGVHIDRWLPGTGDLYANMNDMIEAAGGRIAGMVWYQGCSSACNRDGAGEYAKKFERLVEDFRERYGSDRPVITAQISRHTNSGEGEDMYWSRIREEQRAAAERIPDIAVVPTLDAPISDGIHNSAQGCVMIGHRFADAALGMVYGADIDWKFADVEQVCFADNSRTGIRVSFKNVERLSVLYNKFQDFVVEDSDGPVPVIESSVEMRSVLLVLGRPAGEDARCHLMFGSNPACMLRDHRQYPPLAFYGQPVLQKENIRKG